MRLTTSCHTVKLQASIDKTLCNSCLLPDSEVAALYCGFTMLPSSEDQLHLTDKAHLEWHLKTINNSIPLPATIKSVKSGSKKKKKKQLHKLETAPNILVGMMFASKRPWKLHCMPCDKNGQSKIKGNKEKKATTKATPLCYARKEMPLQLFAAVKMQTFA